MTFASIIVMTGNLVAILTVSASAAAQDAAAQKHDDNRVRLVITEAYKDAEDHENARLRDIVLQALTIAGATPVRSETADSTIPTLTIDLKGNALGASYSSIGYRYTGAQIQGLVSLHRGAATLYEGAFQCRDYPSRQATRFAASNPKEAPFDAALCPEVSTRLIEAVAMLDHVDKKVFLVDILQPLRELPKGVAKPNNRDWLLLVSAARMLMGEADETTLPFIIPFLGEEWYLGEDSSLAAIRGRLPDSARPLLPQAIVSFVQQSGKWNDEYARCLGEAQVPADLVVPLLKHSDDGLRFRAAVIIAGKGDRRAWDTLLDTARGRTKTRLEARREALWMLATLDREKAAPILVETALSDDRVSSAAVEALSQADPETAVGLFVRLWEASKSKGRQDVRGMLRAARQLKDARTLRFFQDVLEDGRHDWMTKRMVIDALGEIPGAKTVDVAIAALNAAVQDDKGARWLVPAAAKTLGSLKDTRSVKPLRKAFESHPHAGIAIAEALGAIGSTEAVEFLRDLAQTAPDADVRAKAKEILKLAGGNGPKEVR